MSDKHDEALAMVLCVLGGKVLSTKPINGTGSLPPYEPVSDSGHTSRQVKIKTTNLTKKKKPPKNQINLFEDKK